MRSTVCCVREYVRLRFGFTYGGSVIVRRARELLFVDDFFEEAAAFFFSAAADEEEDEEEDAGEAAALILRISYYSLLARLGSYSLGYPRVRVLRL